MEYGTKTQTLNPTGIGKHFNVSPQKVNLVLSELGFIENDVAGWKVTKLGKSFRGKELQHDQSGKSFVLWPREILQNKNLVHAFNPSHVGLEDGRIPEPLSPPIPPDNFRHKYPANHRTQDGHFVRSKAEVIIDNWLYMFGFVHSYERKLPIDEDVVSDFYIPSGNGRPQAVYIEFWGLENDPKYQERKRRKIEIYRKYEFPLIELFDADIQNIDDILPRKLLQFKIKTG